MDSRDIPDPPSDYTSAQIKEYYKNYFKQALSLSTTKEGSLAHMAKDAQHEVNQPLPSTLESELPKDAHIETELRVKMAMERIWRA